MTTDPRSLRIQGKSVEGGYVYLMSPDVPGFRFLFEPGEKDLDSMLKVLMECYSLQRAAEENARARKLKAVIRNDHADGLQAPNFDVSADLVPA